MKSEAREQIIEALEQSFAFVGAENYEQAMKKVRTDFAALLEMVSHMDSMDKLRQVLDGLELTDQQEKTLLGAVRFAPAIMGMLIQHVGEVAETTLPTHGPGRPAVGFFAREKIVDFILAKMKAGCSLKQAKTRAAMKFDVSGATIQRAWNERGTGKLPDAADIFGALQSGAFNTPSIEAKTEKS